MDSNTPYIYEPRKVKRIYNLEQNMDEMSRIYQRHMEP
jgi:hypothetical protein